MAEVIFVDHSPEVIKELEKNLEKALEEIGITCQGHAMDILEAGLPRNGGAKTTEGGAGLKGSIDHKVIAGEKAVYVGTDNDHAIYNEYGTGIYAGGSGYWVYVPGGGKAGQGKRYSLEKAKQVMAILQEQGVDAHITQGMRPLHFLKNAMDNNLREYINIIKKYLKQ